MSGVATAIKGSKAAEAPGDWRAVRDAGDIQFAPLDIKQLPKPESVPRETPAWLKWLGDLLADIGNFFGDLFGIPGPVMLKVLIGIAVIFVGLIAWRMLAPLMRARKPEVDQEAIEWTPNRDAAKALLDDADRLAAEGRFDEATHLLLQRSVIQIATAQPDWLHPASTAREIAGLPGLPIRARAAFSLIAARVERSFFALIPLDAADWQAARSAYADFALTEIRAEIST